MHQYINRIIQDTVIERIKSSPAVAIIGPRQCGKSTLARFVLEKFPQSVFIDLELPSDVQKLNEPEVFFNYHHDKLVCIDEIQRMPHLFPVMRSMIDRRERNGQFLLLGSVSRDLVSTSSESLAGRISYIELTPFLMGEFGQDTSRQFPFGLWVRGGFPRSVLASTDQDSFIWRNDFIRTFLERDIPRVSPGIPASQVGRLWQMCAHYHGQMLNYSRIGSALGVSDNTVRNYLHILEGSFLVRLLHPYFTNIKKRLVKSPKLYLRDSGLLHALLGIESADSLLGHPVFGHSWEGFIIDNIIARLAPAVMPFYYRTAKGDEIDLVLEKGRRRIVIECKAGPSPVLTKGFYTCVEDIRTDHSWIVCPVDEPYPAGETVTVSPLEGLLRDERAAGFFQTV